MKNLICSVVIVSFLFVFAACENEKKRKVNSANTNEGSEAKIANLKKAMKAVEPFFSPMSEPEPYDWLANFKEPGQTFDEYIGGKPTLPTAERKIFYIQPLGKFNDDQRKVVTLTADYFERFFNLPVKLLPEQSFQEPLPENTDRVLPSKNRQVRTGYIIDEILLPQLPKDAAALIAFTSEDLFPDEMMYFVFGQASLENRVGVWSLNRLENNADKQKDFKLFLARTLKIASHETGHMFSMAHCTKYECVMSGSNHLGETDRRPLDVCPECMAKICWAMNYEPQTQYERLAEFFEKQNLAQESNFFKTEANAVRQAFAKEN